LRYVLIAEGAVRVPFRHMHQESEVRALHTERYG
jgi:hypothetical protein